MKEWLFSLEKHKPQANALIGGLVVMMFGGLHFAWGIFNHNFGSHFVQHATANMTLWCFWIVTSWFIGAAGGSYIAAMLVPSVRKIKIYVTKPMFVNLCRKLIESFREFASHS